MRFLEVNLKAFGCFTDTTIDLSKSNYGLHIIYGLNEAGKSCALRAVSRLLFGIEDRTTDNFLHANNKLRIGATLLKSNGEKLSIMRRKGKKNTLFDPEDKEEIDETVLKSFLAITEKELFEKFYGIDHDELVSGGNEIKNLKGLFGETLFAAGLGGTNFSEMLQELKADAESLYKSSGSAQKIPKTVKAYQEKKKTARDLILYQKKWESVEKELRETEKDISELQIKIASTRKAKEELDAVKRAFPLIDKYNDYRKRLGEKKNIVVLPDSYPYDERFNRYIDLRSESKRQKKLKESLQQLERQFSSIEVPEDILRHQEEIERFYKRLGTYEQADNDLPGIRKEEEAFRQEARRIISDIFGKDIKEKEYLLPIPVRDSLKSLSKEAVQRERDLKQLSDDLIIEENALHKKVNENKKIKIPENIIVLENLLSGIKNDGNIEDQLAEKNVKLQTEKKQIDISIKELGFFKGGLDELQAMAIPDRATIEKFADMFDSLDLSKREKEKELERIKAKIITAKKELGALSASGDVPSLETLKIQREKRNKGWQLVKRSLLGEKVDRKSVDEYTNGQQLHLAYEASVIEADRIADELYSKAERVQKYNCLSSDLEIDEKEKANLEKEIGILAGKVDELQSEWATLWKNINIEGPLTPKEAIEWSYSRDRILEKASIIPEKIEEISLLEKKIAQHCKSLISCLSVYGIDASKSSDSLAALIEFANDLIKRTTADKEYKKELEKEIQMIEKRIQDIKTKIHKLETEKASWNKKWKDVLAKANLPKETEITVIDSILDELDNAREMLRKAGECLQRIEQMEKHKKEFSGDVQKLLDKVSPDLCGLAIGEAVSQLKSRLTDAQKSYQQKENLSERIGQTKSELLGTEQAIKECKDILDSLCKIAKCKNYEDLDSIEKDSQEFIMLQEKVNDICSALKGDWGDRSIEDIVKKVNEADRINIDLEIESLEDNLKDFDDEKNRKATKKGELRSILSGWDGGSKAADIIDEAQFDISQINESYERYVRLRLTTAILQLEIEKYQKKAQKSLLGRAGEIFSQITCGSFKDLSVEFNESDEKILLGVRPSGEDIVVDAMSEGTRDQLYLALRIAYLEQELQNSLIEPMPFVIDDVLINFDDDRAKATLQLLAELSHKTQIIYFTHHKHILDIAEKAVPEKVLQKQYLVS